MAPLSRRATIASPRTGRGGSMLEWQVRLLTLVITVVAVTDEIISGYNWNW
ncbi:MAG: hypothetical protein ACRDMK_02415 [Gaiellaceae bacterium]